MPRPSSPRLLLLLPTTTYRTAAFVEAARRLGVALTVASDEPSTFESSQPAGLLTLDFAHLDRAVEQAAVFAREHPIAGVVGVDDDTAVLAAVIVERLSAAGELKGNPVTAALAARDAKTVLVGVSVGAGPALLAAADPRVRDRVSVVLSLGGGARRAGAGVRAACPRGGPRRARPQGPLPLRPQAAAAVGLSRRDARR